VSLKAKHRHPLTVRRERTGVDAVAGWSGQERSRGLVASQVGDVEPAERERFERVVVVRCGAVIGEGPGDHQPTAAGRQIGAAKALDVQQVVDGERARDGNLWRRARHRDGEAQRSALEKGPHGACATSA